MADPRPIVIIGAGAAGILAAWRAAAVGASAVLFERNSKAGIKLLISGGGKCNITHDGSAEELLGAFLPAERRFLKPSMYRFSNKEVLRLLEEEGVPTFARPDGRVFPVHGRSRDVVEALLARLRRVGVELRLETRIHSVGCTTEGVTVAADSDLIAAGKVVIATGGVSYAKTGTTGDGITWARQLGHRIVPLRPALAPLVVTPALPADWRGVALRGGRLSIYAGERRVCSWDDDILFTHEGVSGPAALEVSKQAAVVLESTSPVLRFDFFPSKEFADLDEELNSLIRRHASRMLGSVLEMMIPARLASPLLRNAGIDPEKRGHVVRREERRLITRLLKSWTIGTVNRIDIDRGEVSAGGVALDEVDPQTMQSRKHPWLYLCGEVLDIAGPVGGYNLQAAFSTGFVAGESAARSWLEERKADGSARGNLAVRNAVIQK